MMSNWIDAHLHLTDPRLEGRVSTILEEAARIGITRFGLGGVEPEEWERQKRLASLYPGVFFLSFGLHPWWVTRESPPSIRNGLEQLRAELSRAEFRNAAIGETGLDFHPRFSEGSHAIQETVFRAHLRFALEFRRPLVLHVVRAHERAIAILKEERRDASIEYSGIIHSFSEGPEVATAYLELGFALSISAPVITRGRGTAFEKLRQSMVTLPATALVLETDSPDQPLAGESGLNHPANLVRVAEAIAEVRRSSIPGISAQMLLDQSAKNICRIFRLVDLG